MAAEANASFETARLTFDWVEHGVQAGVEWLRLFVEMLGAIVIAAGVAVAVVGLLRHFWSGRGGNFTPIRLSFARYLMLALELQLAADILSTSIAPTWDRIGKLGAIAVIRTALNYFLSQELSGELAAPIPSEDGEARRSRTAEARSG